MNKAERVDDSKRGYDFALAVRRELGVRRGEFVPANEAERRQAEEGLVAYREMDCVKDKP